MSRVSKRNSDARVISDRSGLKYRMRDMVVEPGTNFLVHKNESDGRYSLVNHPLNNIGRFLKGKLGDPYPVANARPDISWVDVFVNTINDINITCSVSGSLSFTVTTALDVIITEDGDILITEDGIEIIGG